MKINTHEEISFTNCHAGIYLSKKEGTIAVEFKSSEIVLYLNTFLYQSLAWLLQNALDNKQLMDFVNWTADPKAALTNTLIELHGPEHSVCLACIPKHERVQLNFEIGASIDLKFSDFKGLAELVSEAQNDLEWRRYLLQWTFTADVSEHFKNNNDSKNQKSL